MPKFIEMDPELVRAAIAGYENMLTPEADKLEHLYRSKKCPRCRIELQKEFDPRHTFSDEGTAVPRALLRCVDCRYLLNPHDNMIIEYGDASKTPIETLPIIDPNRD